MTPYEAAREDVMLYVLTEFPSDHAVVYVEALIKRILRPVYAGEWIDGFWAQLGDEILGDLVAEYNRRLRLGLTLRFELVDDIGSKIRGRAQPADDALFEEFQNGLLGISASEFELLAASVLFTAGCTRAWATPQSHDEGLDAFGVMPIANLPTTNDSEDPHPWVIMLAQAKHYHKSKVRTGDIRELVGSQFLALRRIYSTADEKYVQLETRPLAPLALFLISSGEVTKKAQGLARRAGVFLLTSGDLFTLLRKKWEAAALKVDEAVLPDLIRQELKGIVVAR